MMNKDILVLSVWLLTVVGLLVYLTFICEFYQYVEKVRQTNRAKASLLYALLYFSMVAGLAIIVVFVEGDPINDLFLVPVLYSFMCGLSFFGLVSFGIYLARKRLDTRAENIHPPGV